MKKDLAVSNPPSMVVSSWVTVATCVNRGRCCVVNIGWLGKQESSNVKLLLHSTTLVITETGIWGVLYSVIQMVIDLSTIPEEAIIYIAGMENRSRLLSKV